MKVLVDATIDPEDWSMLCIRGIPIRLTYKRNGDRDSVVADTDSGPVRLHRLLLGLKAADSHKFVDHINGDPFDNRRENLRICSNAQNQMNARPHRDKESKLPKGVTKSKCNPNFPYQARISVLGTRIQIGYYATPEQAARAYQIVAEGLHGKFEYVTSRSKK